MSTKLPPDLLRKLILSRTGAKLDSVLVGPMIGEDAAIIDLGDKVLVVHGDPITAAVENIGWLAVNVASNDIAVRGAEPRWLLVIMFLPEGTSDDVIDRITKQLDEAAKELGIAIIGGHTEYTVGIDRPIIAATCFGIAGKNEYVTTSGARVGDCILMTKGAGIEGTSILASDFRDELIRLGVGEDVISRALEFSREISVVREAIALARVGASSMHDPTEGGVLCGLLEMAYASGKRFVVYEEKILVRPETRAICSALKVDPLKLISSGTLLATIPENKVDAAVGVLEELDVSYGLIGRVEEGEGVVVVKRDGRKVMFREPYIIDELREVWRRFRE